MKSSKFALRQIGAKRRGGAKTANKFHKIPLIFFVWLADNAEEDFFYISRQTKNGWTRQK